MRVRSITYIYNPENIEYFKNHPNLSDSEYFLAGENFLCFINENYKTGIPQRMIWNENLGIILHGIVFPRDHSFDDFAKDPDPILAKILHKHRNHPVNIPREFINGTYVAFVVDREKKYIYAFTCFLNSIPLYYTVVGNTLILSTDFYKISKLSHAKIDSIHNGLIEYYHLGTNLSKETGVTGIITVPKGGYIQFDGKQLICDYYYRFPSANYRLRLNQVVDRFAELWHYNLNAINNKHLKFGLGLTGGIDSRLILAGWPDRENLITFTGGHPLDPDYILARKITETLHIDKNHFLEDYRNSDKINGYIEFLKISDNPSLINNIYFIDQMLFRVSLGLNFEMIGLTEYLGGVYHYLSRTSIKSTIEMTLPLCSKRIRNKNFSTYLKLIKLGLRENVFDEILENLNNQSKTLYLNHLEDMVNLINRQIIEDDTVETYLEQFRHVHKMANLLTWNRLPGRSFNECFSPSMNIDLTDFAASIPLKIRENRKVLLAYLKRYHPDFARIILSGSIFTPNAPWILHKIFNPYIKAFNALGYKIPYFQWYINSKYKNQSIEDSSKFTRFQQFVCESSPFLKETFLWTLYQKYKNNLLRRWRLFNIALLERRINLNDSEYGLFLETNYEKTM